MMTKRFLQRAPSQVKMWARDLPPRIKNPKTGNFVKKEQQGSFDIRGDRGEREKGGIERHA